MMKSGPINIHTGDGAAPQYTVEITFAQYTVSYRTSICACC